MHLNTSEFVVALADKTGLSKADAERAMKAYHEIVSDTLSQDGKITLVGFGGWQVSHRNERMGHNPRTGEKIHIAASKAPTFKAGKGLKDKVNV